MHKDKKSSTSFKQSMATFFEPLFVRHQHYYRKSKLHLWVDVIFLLIIITLFSTILYFQLATPKPAIVMELSLDQENLVSGQTNTATLAYKNNGMALDDVVIAVHLPTNYELLSTSPEDAYDSKNHVFSIGRLPRGGNGTISLTGLTWGTINHEVNFAFDLSFTKNGKEDSVLYSKAYNFTDSVIKTDLILPAHAYAGSVLPVKINIANTSQRPVKNLSLEFNPDWQFASDNDVTSVKKIDILNPGEIKKIDIALKRKNDSHPRSLALSTILNINKKKIVLNSNATAVSAVAPNVSFGLQTDAHSLKNNNQLPVLLKISNKEQAPIKNIAFNLLTSNRNVKIVDINFINNRISRNGTSLIIENLDPNEELSIPLGISIQQLEVLNNAAFNLVAEVTYSIDNQTLETEVMSSTVVLASELNVKSVAYYFSPQGDQLGIGPLPPIVDLPTTYWIFWQADNKGNDLTNFTMTGHLPTGASLTDQKSLLAGNFHYDKNTNQVSWTIDKIDKDGGNNKIGFEISITPTIKNIGKVMPILSNISFKGEDSYAKVKLSGQLPNLTTDLSFDKNVHDSGVVTQ